MKVFARVAIAMAAGLLAGTACSAPLPPEAPAAGHAPTLTVETDKSFTDVVEELEFAITERNFRITGRNSIGAGIRERGHADFPEVEVIHFCNLEYAREVLEIDRAFVAQMPCRVAVYESGDGRTVITMILVPEDHPDPRVNAFARRMNGLLREIVDYARGPSVHARTP